MIQHTAACVVREIHNKGENLPFLQMGFFSASSSRHSMDDL